MSDSRSHAVAHAHAPKDFGRAFAIGISLNIAFVVIEAGFGFSANSMALIADAGHNLSDVLGLIVAWAGAMMARTAPSPRFTYGLKKASILSALANALFLLVAVGAIVAEAVRRFFHPSPAEGGTVMIVATIGIVVNGVTALLFMRGRADDINIRGAFLHMAADAVVSAAVVGAGLLILLTGHQWIDPTMSLVIAAVIFWSTFGLLKESVGMSLAGVPSGVAVEEVEDALGQIDGVIGVHHIHVWALSTTEIALTAHLIAPEGRTDRLVERARHMLHDRFRIGHCTIQVERRDAQDGRC